jgi:hypothetical protein
VLTPKCSKAGWDDGETWQVKKGILHINPAYLDFARETLKVKNDIDEELEDGIAQLNIEAVHRR